MKPNELILPTSQIGDLWQLGTHRLLCGDCLQPEGITALLAGEKADLVFTDPPYNVNYEGKQESRLTLANDKMKVTDYAKFLASVFALYREVMKEKASLYVCHASLYQRELQNALEENGFAIRNQIIWAKNHFNLSFARYKYQHEVIFYCYIKQEKDAWYGDKSQSTLWRINKPLNNKIHPTMKPVDLVEIALRNSSQPQDIVIDFFGGAGSTLIACENLQRRAFLIEIMPHYVDCIINRWQQLTKQPAKLLATGQTFNELSIARLSEVTQVAASA